MLPQLQHLRQQHQPREPWASELGELGSGYDAAHSHTAKVARMKPRFLDHLGVGDESVAASVSGLVAPLLPQAIGSLCCYFDIAVFKTL